MKIGLKVGMSGSNVERLQRALVSAGHEIERDEIDGRKFGPSTLAALQAFQSRHGLRRTKTVNKATLEILLEFEQNITININEAPGQKPTPKSDQHRGVVQGKFVDQDGAPIANTKISLFSELIRSETSLGNATTNAQGQYKITYRRPSALNLLARAYDDSGTVLAASQTIFYAAAEVEIDLTTAPDRVVRVPSFLTKLQAEVTAQLGSTPLAGLTENTTTHELTFLANSIGESFDNVACLYIAHKLGLANGLQDVTLFGIFYQGIPASLDAALASLPNAGIDDTFDAQVLSGVLAHSDSALGQALTSAIAANVIPASYAAAQASQLSMLDTLRTTSTGSAPYIRGKTPLNDLLNAGSVAANVQAAFVQAYAANSQLLGPTWKALRANTTLSAADLTVLNTTLSAGELLGGNLVLVKDTLSRLAQGTLSSLQNLALLDLSDWVTRITSLDPEATSIPPVLPNDTPELRIARFAKALAERFAGRYPTTAFVGGLSKPTTSSFDEQTKASLINFLSSNPTLNLKTGNIDKYVFTQKAAISATTLQAVKTVQRLLRISPHYTSVEALNAAGYQSAQSIYFKGREAFIEQMTESMGSASLASMAYGRAQIIYATSLAAFGRFHLALNGVNFGSTASASPDPAAIENYPDLQALFGSLDYFQCADCQSVYSPAAYLVDLLQYLSQFKATPASGASPSLSGVTTALGALLFRRPEIQYIALDCNNMNTTLPYIDMVNEILEAAISPPATPVTLIDTTGTSAERRALPQQINQNAYNLTQGVNFPLSLPFDLPFAQTTAYLAALGTSRAAILTLFAGNLGVTDVVIACACLGINPEMQAVIDTQDTTDPWTRWGFTSSQPSSLIDPKTRQYYTLSSTDNWITALSRVPVLLNRAALTLQQLFQLLEVNWVTQGSVVLQLGDNPDGTLSSDTDLMSFNNTLTGNVLDRADRFLRLWTASRLQMWELDWALDQAVGGVLNDSFLVMLSGALALRKRLNLPFQEVLSFWGPMETRDVTNHLGDEDVTVPSTYSEVFRNPAVLASWDTIFVALNAASLSGNLIFPQLPLSGSQPTPEQSAISAALTLSADDISAILTFTGADNKLTLRTLNTLLQYQRLASSLSLSVSDLILWIQLTEGRPFSIPITAVTNTLPLGINTVMPHGLGNGDQITITGVLGNTAANGVFTITLINSTSFSVNGLNGNGDWTGAAFVVNGPADTLEFLRRLAVLQGIGIALHDLDYLLRHQSASQSSLAFTTTQATVVLQSIRDAIAKLPSIAIIGASNESPIEITTSVPHALTTGLLVSISGVVGNTAANGSFTVTVTGPTTFTLDGTTGNGTWTSGGIVTVDSASAIQTIFVGALATATGASGNVVTPALLATGILPLSSATATALLAETSGVNPTQFTPLISAFTSVAKAAALFKALQPSEVEFTFIALNATILNLLNPCSLPITATDTSPYTAFEALLRAIKLDHRQAALTPKLFDVFNEWPTTITVGGTWASGQVYSFTIVGAQAQVVPISYMSVPGDLNNDGVAASIVGLINFSPAVTGSAPFLNAATPSGSVITLAGLTLAGQPIGAFGYAVVNPAASGTGTLQVGIVTPDLASALNASLADVTAIAAALNAQAPSANPATQSGTLCDMAMLTSIANALDVCARYSIGGATLVQLATAPATSDTATAAMGAFQAQYAPSAWFGAVQPVEDNLRQQRRDALVAYLLGQPMPSLPVPLLTTDDIFDYFLIDSEMSSCAVTTRLLQAALAVQQFVQQCFLNLTFQITIDTTNTQAWDEWSWRQQYELWSANRQVFLYPENYLLPELRTDASSFFSDLESDLRQSDCDADAAESAFENYLRKLVEVANLVVAAHYNETRADGSLVLHVFAHTAGTTPKWYYRTCTTQPPAAGIWSAWEVLNLDIHSDQLLPVIWDQRLFLIWPVFTQISEKQSDQNVPSGGGGAPQPAPQKFWAVEFAFSELSSGQWQPKRTIKEKMYLATWFSQHAFTFQAKQDDSSNLQINTCFTGFFGSIDDRGQSNQTIIIVPSNCGSVALATLPMPDAPLQIVEWWSIIPPSDLIDLNQEPTYALLLPTPGPGSLPLGGSVATPSGYTFFGQYLVYGSPVYSISNVPTPISIFPPPGSEETPPTTSPSPVQLDVLSTTASGGNPTSITLLNNINNPRIVVPQQEGVFDSLDPFFVADLVRTYLVLPQYYTVSSSPQELQTVSGFQQWSTSYIFQSFYHPYARTFLRELEIGGVSQLLSRNLQLNPLTVRGWSSVPGWPTFFDFNSIYGPTNYVATPFPGAPGAPDPGESALDFGAPGISAAIGAYTLYNWEIFYHVPMFIASLLTSNQRYQDAMTWLKYIFNPSDTSGGTAPQRFWEMAPFYNMNATGTDSWQSQQIQSILTSGMGDPAIQAAIQNWMNDPFDPHMVASFRIAAYGKATVMKFLDNLIAWGDSLYSQYTMETVSQAEQLYIIADLILGPAPDQVPMPSSYEMTSQAETYASLQNINQFSETLISIENLILSPTPPPSLLDGTATTPSLPQFPSSGKTLLFCIPANPQLLAYWSTVAQRLYNIRHCLNMQGIAQPLPLYGPPVNILALIEQQAGGAGSVNGQPFAPIYRFATYLQRALDLTNDVRAYGALILAALEKKDAEHLAALRASQDLNIQTAMLDVKTQQVTEAQDQITALQNQQAVVQIRYNFYKSIQFMNPWETAAMSLQGAALIANGLAIVLDMTAGEAHMIPSFSVGVSGFGGTPTVTASFGGENVAAAASSWGAVTRGLAGILSESGSMAATLGGYQRRMDDWTLQANLANAELTQIASQITAANDRLNIANSELNIQNQQIANAQAVSDFLTNKYTNEQLYDWMLSQLTTVYTQAYQLAVGLALQAQAVFQYELGSSETFIQFGYWDSQHKGLTAGESLLFDLRRMEAQYLAENSRERELTKHVSLAITQPMALIQLIEKGTCTFSFDEAMFDHDHPGHYFRRLRSVAVTIPCVTGPYTGINGTLLLNTAIIRTTSTLPSSGYKPVNCAMMAQSPSPLDPSTFSVTTPGTAINTSTGQNDAGLFEVNLKDERWLPFEGFGAISSFTLELNPQDNNIDFSTITDIVVHLRYTARAGIDEQTVRNAINTKPIGPRSILVSVRNTFGSAYFNFFNPTNTPVTQQTLTLPFTNVIFPFSNLGNPEIVDVGIYVVLTQAAAGTSITGATFGQTSAASPTNVSFTPVPGQNALGNSIPVLSGTGSSPLASSVESLTMTVPANNGQLQLASANVEDIILIIKYTLD